MMRTRLACLFALSALLALAAACGDNVAARPDGGPDPDAEPDAVDPTVEPAACAESGIACVFLGTGVEGFNGDGHHRRTTDIYWSMDMLFASDGTIWFIDWNNHLIRKLLPDQTVETVVGWSDPIFPGDGTGDMTERTAAGADGSLVKLNHPTELVEAADGAILVMAWHNHKLRRIDPVTENVTIVAGAGAGFSGDGPLAAAIFRQPKVLTNDADGNLYIGDQANFRIRRVDTSGNIATIVGTGTQGSGGDDGPGLSAQLNWEAGSNPEPSGGMVVAAGRLYIADTLSNKIRVLDLTTMMITTFAGTGTPDYTGDGGAAAEATFNKPRELEIGPDGDLYIADTDNNVIRAIDLDTNLVRTVAGTGELGKGVEGTPATEFALKRPFGLEFDPDGNLYIMDTINSRIVRVTR